MPAAVTLGVAAACFAAAAIAYLHRDGVLRLTTRLRGFDGGRSCCRQGRLPRGSRSRYLRGTMAGVDMMAPSAVLFLAGVGLLVTGLLQLR